MAQPLHLFPPAPSTERGRAVKISSVKDDSLIYCTGRGVFIRSLKDPGASISYFGHVQPATVAKVSPSGYFVASADASGLVRVWDLAGTEQILKNETRPIAGRINDLQWDGESKRLIAVGEGKERFGHAFAFDSGSSVGEITGHSKAINAVAIRPSRPFRAVTGSDDNALVFLHGTPYKFNKVIRTHSSFVHALHYSASGSHFVSGGADRKLFLYDGSSGDVLTADGLEGHLGSVFAVSFNPDGTSVASSSADQSVRTWDVETSQQTAKWSFHQQQVGGTHLGEQVISVSLNGDINVIDKRQPEKAAQTLFGHQRGITALTFAPNDNGTFYSGSYDGRVNSFSEEGQCRPVAGSGHSNQVVALSPGGSTLLSAGMDDNLMEIDVDTKAFRSTFSSTGNLPKGLASDSNGTAFLATVKDVQVIGLGGKQEASIPVDYAPTAIAHSSSRAEVAVGGEDGKTRLYTKALKLDATLDKNRSAVTALAYNPDGSLLAVGDSGGKILVYDTASKEAKINQWVFHTARVSSIQFSPDGQFAVSGSLDTNVYVWSVARPSKKVAIKNAHAGGVNAVVWVNDKRIASAGSDAGVRVWDVQLPA